MGIHPECELVRLQVAQERVLALGGDVVLADGGRYTAAQDHGVQGVVIEL